MSKIVTLDFETRSEADLKKVGAWAYSEHDTTDVIVLAFKGPGEETPSVWWPDHDWLPEPSPYALSKLRDRFDAWIDDPEILFEAHNVAFEISHWKNIMVRRYGMADIPLHRWRDTMAVASYYALPAGLDKLLHVLGFQGKDSRGSKLISKYSKLHNKSAKRIIPASDFKAWCEYCKDDVEAEHEVSNFLGDLPEHELPLFLMDLEIEMLGLPIDLDGVEAATEVVERRKKELEDRFKEITGVRPTQRDKAMAWFKAQGLELESLKGDYLQELLEDEEVQLPGGPVREAIKLRLKINKASTTKLLSMARQAAKDGVARFQCRYHGAQTGRWTGTGFQPLNLVRSFEKVDPEQLVRDINHRDPEVLDMLYGDAMQAVSKALRHYIIARPGQRILAGDFVSIEAIVLACLAEEEWKIKAFRDKVGIYELMACKIHGLDPALAMDKKAFKEKYPNERQDGKTGELAFGYQGALNAWLNFDDSGRHSDEKIIEFCRGWRKEHPNVAGRNGMWRGLEAAAIKAVQHPGDLFSWKAIGFETVDDWLSMILPDGKRIWYWKPELRVKMPSWHKPFEEEDCASGHCDCKPQPQLTYMAQKFGQWRRISTYGGKLTENAVQATSRQILKYAMLGLKRAGYPICLTVYDEIVCMRAKGVGSKEEFAKIMTARPGFAKDWPISVDVWEGNRYKK